MPLLHGAELLENAFDLSGVGRPDEKVQRHRIIVVGAGTVANSSGKATRDGHPSLVDNR
jgi:hypothetical protein